MEPSDSSGASRLADNIAALQVRQAALHERLSGRNGQDADAAADLDASFLLLPDYVQKLQRVQQLMDTLAKRTSQMRTRCNSLLNDEDRCPQDHHVGQPDESR